jgi:hypothetical protein
MTGYGIDEVFALITLNFVDIFNIKDVVEIGDS